MTAAPAPPDDAASRIAAALEEDIIFGRLAPGSRLVEDPLMARFDATRHAIRQALVLLERGGVVSRERNKGATVRGLTRQEVDHLYEVRELLVRQAVLRIPVPAPEGLVDALERLHDEHDGHRRARRWRAVHEANDRFHLTLFAGCGNEVLVDMIRQTMNASLPVRAIATTDAERTQDSGREHLLMIRLLQGADRWALAQLCVDHLQPARQRYLAHHHR